VLVERAETPLFYVDEELRRKFAQVDVAAVVADVTDEAAVRRVFERERPAVVFHAAASKHVPLSEANVAATVWTNVRGTRLVAHAAAATGCAAFIFISTDKAVDPTSIMGATKRVGEAIIRSVGAEAEGRFLIVRFGNVMGSQGSVLELFRQQIAEGGPVTVTDPAMTRFFMTIPEAVRLILHTGAVGRSGDVHVLNMGQPIRIVDLARDLIRLSSPAGAKDIGVVFTGLRPGERLEETLFADDEEAVETGESYLLVARPREGAGRLNGKLAGRLERLEELAAQGAEAELRQELTAVVAAGAA
jgi:FlaA1/EpsC-like NDP-sugar epimerase